MKLYIVPTPIGNLKDITLRALDVLSDVELVLAEDTRTTAKLLKHYSITTIMQSYHMHNEHKVLDSILNKLKSGMSLALVSDAGTPAISDPGFLLVRACVQNDIEVECLPGATALIPALVNSGLPCDRFIFEGFLPPKKGRQTRLELLSQDNKTIVLYESPHKLVKTLTQICEYFGPSRSITVSRELSKLYEETKRGTAKSVLEYYQTKPPKGEIVIIISGT
ncbi:MAG: 16S rRNA (cytidine(1402)-2'-O)-methyltransferase [Flavobacteriaceae bacterium]